MNGKQTVVIGGAYSIDKAIHITYGWGWWEDEQPSDEITFADISKRMKFFCPMLDMS